MRLLLVLAARNLFRHTRRTLLTASGLALGIGLMVLGRAWTAAMEKAVVEPAKGSALGHVLVYARDAAADEGGEVSFILPQNNHRLIAQPQSLIARVLEREPRLRAGLARLMVGAILSSGETSMEAILIGIDPRKRADVYPALELREGRHFEPGENGILLNPGVASRLGARLGDTVVSLGYTTDGRLSAVRLKVTGVWVVKGLEAYEWGACYVDLAAVQELLDVGEAAGVLILRQNDLGAASGPVAASLNDLFQREAVPAEAYTWEEMGGPFIGGVLLNRFISGVTNVLMALIVAAGVMNTALISVFERTREVGTLRALGARRARVLAMFLLEAVMLGLGGAAAGALFGTSLIAVLGRFGIPAFSEAQRYSYGGDYLFPSVSWADAVTVPAVMVVVCVLAAFGPALMAARMRPADSLRYV
jgi:putative ABC transport system permease protein